MVGPVLPPRRQTKKTVARSLTRRATQQPLLQRYPVLASVYVYSNYNMFKISC